MLKYIIVLLFSIPLNLFSVDFDDLKKKKGKYYGSEKEKKIFLDLGIIEIEKWEGHNSVHYLGTPMSMSYPKYKMDNSFPLYYYEKSLVDDRYESNILVLSHYSKYARNKGHYLLFPFLTFGKNEESSYSGVLPFYYYKENNSKNAPSNSLILPGFYRESNKNSSTQISPFHIYNTQKDNNGLVSSTLIMPIFPIYFKDEDELSNHTNFSGIFDFNYDKNINKIDRIWTFPFVFWKRDSYFHIAPVYFSEYSEDETTGSWFGIIPPMYSSNSPNHSTFYAVNYYN
ncbi:MAG: hypothetical protein KDK36_20595, partial [Leptospiraceae bacterium]|nr:hypothetical protein [Leptospiraceae bacterium]